MKINRSLNGLKSLSNLKQHEGANSSQEKIKQKSKIKLSKNSLALQHVIQDFYPQQITNFIDTQSQLSNRIKNVNQKLIIQTPQGTSQPNIAQTFQKMINVCSQDQQRVGSSQGIRQQNSTIKIQNPQKLQFQAVTHYRNIKGSKSRSKMNNDDENKSSRILLRNQNSLQNLHQKSRNSQCKNKQKNVSKDNINNLNVGLPKQNSNITNSTSILTKHQSHQLAQLQNVSSQKSKNNDLQEYQPFPAHHNTTQFLNLISTENPKFMQTQKLFNKGKTGALICNFPEFITNISPKSEKKNKKKQSLKRQQININSIRTVGGQNNQVDSMLQKKNLLQNYNKLINELQHRKSVNEKIHNIFNQTQPELISLRDNNQSIHKHSLLSQTNKLSTQLFVEASDMDGPLLNMTTEGECKLKSETKNKTTTIIKNNHSCSPQRNFPNIQIKDSLKEVSHCLPQIKIQDEMIDQQNLLKIISEQQLTMQKLVKDKNELESSLKQIKEDVNEVKVLKNKLEERDKFIQSLQTNKNTDQIIYSSSFNSIFKKAQEIGNCQKDSILANSDNQVHLYQSYLNAFDTVSSQQNQNISPVQSEKTGGASRGKQVSQDQGGDIRPQTQMVEVQERPPITSTFRKNKSVQQFIDRATNSQNIQDQISSEAVTLFEKHFANFKQEELEKDNTVLNKELLLMRNKIFTFVRCYDKYTQRLKEKIKKLEIENVCLKQEKLNNKTVRDS